MSKKAGISRGNKKNPRAIKLITKAMKYCFLLIVIFSLQGCNRKTLSPGIYLNTKYYTDAPINILSLTKEKFFSMNYPNVIGEKILGIWEVNGDTLILHIKSELKNNYQDTLSKTGDIKNKYLIKNGQLYSASNGWVLKRK